MKLDDESRTFRAVVLFVLLASLVQWVPWHPFADWGRHSACGAAYGRFAPAVAVWCPRR